MSNLHSEWQCRLQEFRIRRRGDGDGDRESLLASMPTFLCLEVRSFDRPLFRTVFLQPRNTQTRCAWFLSGPPHEPDNVALNAFTSGSEEIELIDDVFYLHAPEGFGRSKPAAGVEQLLGVGATSRNWPIVPKSGEMARGVSDIINAPNRLRLEHARWPISP